MALQTGAWSANIGGVPMALTIESITAKGAVTASLPGASFCNGFWDEDEQSLTFVVFSPQAPMQIFTGYLFTDSVNVMGVSGSVFLTLAGTFESYPVTGVLGPAPSAKRSAFGWYAQIGVD